MSVPPISRRILDRLERVYTAAVGRYAVTAYSQEGEDLILARLFAGKADGFYVDVGAHHPQRFSNTYLFYRRGWRGINIDAMPGSMLAFSQIRPRDINLEIAVGSEPTELTYHIFSDKALNTFDKKLVEKYQESYELKEEIVLQSRRLDEILEQYLPRNQSIDFLSVDAEGFDLAVLQSNNWQQYRPTYVLAETYATKGSLCTPHPISTYLAEQDYVLVAHTMYTGLFRAQNVT
jgi:FkbM family methyltransferase